MIMPEICANHMLPHHIFDLCHYDYYLRDTIKVKRIIMTQDCGVIVTLSSDTKDIQETPIYDVFDISKVTKNTIYNFLVKHNIVKKDKSIKAKVYILKYVDTLGSIKVRVSDSMPSQSIDDAYYQNMKYVGFDEVEIDI